MRWNTPAAASVQPLEKSVTPNDFFLRPAGAGVSTQQSRIDVSPRAVKLLLLAAGATLVACQLAKIALRSLRGTCKVGGKNSLNEENPQTNLQKRGTDEDRIEIAAERKEWK